MALPLSNLSRINRPIPAAPRGAAISAGLPRVVRQSQDVFQTLNRRNQLLLGGLGGFGGSIFDNMRDRGSPLSMFRPRGPLLGRLAQQPLELTRAESVALLQTRFGMKGPANAVALEKLEKSAEFKSMTKGLQTRVLKSFVAGLNDPARVSDLSALLVQPEFKSLEPRQKAYALDVFDQANAQGRKSLSTLLKRQVDGKSAALDTDSKGVTLIERMSFLARGGMDLRFESASVTRSSLVSSILQEVATPGQINQSNHSTCTVTSMQYMLCNTDPAEYVRLMQGLVNGGTVKTQSGVTLTRVPDSIANDTATNRSASERIFQSAMMELSNDTKSYSNVSDLNTTPKGDTNTGLWDSEEERGLEALFGHQFTNYTGEKDRSGSEMLDKLRGRSPGQTLTNFAWGTGQHAVVVTKLENGRVYFRNPWGPTNEKVGTTKSDPARQIEDANGLESMTEAEFIDKARNVFID
ncbi:MAG: hypothetical protein QM817_26385 [Archangium sp.]